MACQTLVNTVITTIHETLGKNEVVHKLYSHPQIRSHCKMLQIMCIHYQFNFNHVFNNYMLLSTSKTDCFIKLIKAKLVIIQFKFLQPPYMGISAFKVLGTLLQLFKGLKNWHGRIHTHYAYSYRSNLIYSYFCMFSLHHYVCFQSYTVWNFYTCSFYVVISYTTNKVGQTNLILCICTVAYCSLPCSLGYVFILILIGLIQKSSNMDKA